jgi:hypothetical protein
MLRGRGLRIASRMPSSRGRVYRSARLLSFCVPAYDRVRRSSGRLRKISLARYYIDDGKTSFQGTFESK